MNHLPELSAPRPPAPAPRPPFPWIAALAPVLSAAVLFAVTRSPTVLAFAALGPVVVIASSLDAKRVRRRTERAEDERYARESAAYEEALAERERNRLAELRAEAPDAREILRGGLPADTRWRRRAEGFAVVLGRGVLSSGTGAPMAEAPLRTPATVGIGVAGPPVLTRAFARGLLIQALELVPPEELAVVLPPGPEWDCLRSAPHARGDSPGAVWRVVDVDDGGVGSESERLVVLASRSSDLPPACRCVVELGGPGGDRVIGREAVGRTEELAVGYVSTEEARRYSDALAGASSPVSARAVPDAVSLVELGALRRVGGGPGLPVVLGIGADGPVEVDLVADGPHAIVGGTTGSGKSELLVAWVLALAARYDPAAVTFLLADFKGGAGFAPLAGVPHVTGVITDLDPHGADRAFASVAAELRRREVVLARHGAPDIARLPRGALARLVVVVDECAVVLERSPDLHRAFADIAARGRSLGVHLVLCTQRPVGVVRDAVAANCGLRIALRVHDAADSRALLGTDAAARIPHASPGRCVVSAGGRRTLVQTALAGPGDIPLAIAAGDADVPVHRPWLDPLPAHLGVPPDDRAGLLLGVVDRPTEQTQEAVVLTRPSLLVLGAAGTGRTSTLRMLAEQLGAPPVLGAEDAEEIWDEVVSDRGGEAPLLLDDLDLLLRRCSDEERRRLLDSLQTAVRSGRRRIVVSARRTTDGIAALRDGVDDVLLLRAASRQDHQLLAVDGEPFRAELPPGGGWWHGDRLQVFECSRPALARERRLPPPLPVGAARVAILTNSARALRTLLDGTAPVLSVEEALAADGGERSSVILGTVAEWATARGLLAGIRRDGAVVLDVPPLEARIVLGPLPVAPLCTPGSLVLEEGGRLRRSRWPDSSRNEAATSGIRGLKGV
jgi:S-DNA-T family DNA segregation ATPase FtsK/SpoIIIE